MAPFDSCAQQSMKDFKQASQDGNLVPSVAHSMAASSYVQGAIFDVVTNFFNDPAADPQKAAQQLAAAIGDNGAVSPWRGARPGLRSILPTGSVPPSARR